MASVVFSSGLLCFTKPRTRPLLLSSPPPLSHRVRSPESKNPTPPRTRTLVSSMEATQSQSQIQTPTQGHDGQQGAETMKLLFVEMGVGYDQHGQDITAAAVRACKDAISSNSIPAFRRGSIPGVNTEQMKLHIKLGLPRPTQHLLDAERVKAVFPYGKIISFEVVDGGMVCSSGVCLEAMGDKNDDCYIVNAAVYVGY